MKNKSSENITALSVERADWLNQKRKLRQLAETFVVGGRKHVDLEGVRVGRWLVIQDSPGANCLCLCDCGTTKRVRRCNLLSFQTKSCGCFNRDVRGLKHFTHLCSKTPTYSSWCAMRKRCLNSSDPNFRRYGGRGIIICERWTRFESFLADMGEKPEGHSIGRIDVHGNYCPENCRWETPLQQMQNMSRNKFLTYKGTTLCLSEWARRLNVWPALLSYRLNHGWTPERTIEVQP